MSEAVIEAYIASPPERDELVVQLFVKDGDQFAEIYREENRYMIELYAATSQSLVFDLSNMLRAIARSHAELKERVEAPDRS